MKAFILALPATALGSELRVQRIGSSLELSSNAASARWIETRDPIGNPPYLPIPGFAALPTLTSDQLRPPPAASSHLFGYPEDVVASLEDTRLILETRWLKPAQDEMECWRFCNRLLRAKPQYRLPVILADPSRMTITFPSKAALLAASPFISVFWEDTTLAQWFGRADILWIGLETGSFSMRWTGFTSRRVTITLTISPEVSPAADQYFSSGNVIASARNLACGRITMRVESEGSIEIHQREITAWQDRLIVRYAAIE